ncbi:hypothetical protein [Deinococcus peraridilitoris]|uniref:Uncharacterized protein n=1 Tax=Deinococcus peraridilitoris (strain DSM 19664 / LMG 22246 / CIP 109416 / KR-200) TaxID=937777 RepID=L0A253_DEIPD|nr:hypothetical protein [Deinococcus peraridilitoris]AFZ67080.1 hypothetical protein Deipe_1539 [Deinococcus peraridilitoris DSM 19664]
MPKNLNRSPCLTAVLTAGIAAGTATTTLRENAAPSVTRAALEPPAHVLTPERLGEREGGVQAGQTYQDVSLHETNFIAARPRLKEEKRGGVTVTTVTADVAYCDVINRNGRYYPRSAYEAANAAAAPDLAEGGLWALMEHPEWWDSMKGRLENIATLWESLDIEDRTIDDGQGGQKTVGVVVAKGVIVETQKGLDAKALLRQKVKVGISTNGTASIQYVKAALLDPNFYDPEMLIPVVQNDFTYATIDYVSDPSNLGGRASTQEDTRPGPSAPLPVAPSTSAPNKEGHMHPLLKALCDKHGKTLEQVKKEHAQEYYGVLETIAEQVTQAQANPQTPSTPGTAGNPQPNAPPATETRRPAPRAGTPDEESLESQVLELTSELRSERQERVRTARLNIVSTALESANLRPVPARGEIDFEARFRERLEAAAISADNDQEARTVVADMIEERRGLVGSRDDAGRPAPPRAFEHLDRTNPANRGPALPVGNNGGHTLPGQPYAPVMEAARDFGL